MNRGDHIYVRRRARYSHHGIYCGDGTVIHYVGGRGTLRRVERTSLEPFASGGEIRVRAYRTRLPVEEIVRNAESKLGTHGYHLVRNNCEHLATWSATGLPKSSQVRRWAIAGTRSSRVVRRRRCRRWSPDAARLAGHGLLHR